mgnify:CR=1 FL=1
MADVGDRSTARRSTRRPCRICDLGFPGNIFSCPFMWEAFDRFLGSNGHAVEIGPRGLTLQEEFADAWRRRWRPRFKDEPLVFGYNLLERAVSRQLDAVLPEPAPVVRAPPTRSSRRSPNLSRTRSARSTPTRSCSTSRTATNFNAGFPTHHGDVDVDRRRLLVPSLCVSDDGGAVPPGVRPRLRSSSRVQRTPTRRRDAFAPRAAPHRVRRDRRLRRCDRTHRGGPPTPIVVGWQYWAWWNRDPCCDAPRDEGVIDDPANSADAGAPQRGQARRAGAARSRARVAGTPLSWSFDRAARRFTMSYATTPVDGALGARRRDRRCGSRERHFPGGYDVGRFVRARR